MTTRCDLTVHQGAPAIRLRTDDGGDITHPLTPSEAAAIVSRLARTLATFHTPTGDRTGESLAHPDNDVLRDIHDQEPAA